MIVSWDWLNHYVKLGGGAGQRPTADLLAERLMMAGLNHEDTQAVGADLAINVEVTSNRPDCLGHIGMAREAAVLFNLPLTIPAAEPVSGTARVEDLAQVRVDNPDQCPRYTARVIRGVKVGPSPKWLADRLATIGVAAINNVVDVTNYVLFECGQPLHAFDLTRLAGRQIIVRRAQPGETFLAINHRSYTLDKNVCVIADAKRTIGLAGVMGGAGTEVSTATTELLIESAEFDPMSIRATARALNLHSDSSYRFERGLDPQGIDWASRRACELILELAGGELAAGVLDVGAKPQDREPITLRFAQLKRVLGIDVPPELARQILTALGNRELKHDERRVEVVPPSWRRDLTREIDLVEEVARVHGYDKIPEDVSVPMAKSHRTETDRVLDKVRGVLTGAGYDEALTCSAVEEPWSEAFSPWSTEPALKANTPVLRRADRLRRSIVPSLLGARQTNEAVGNAVIELFEIAHVYLPRGGQLPREEMMIALTSGGDYLAVKGVIEALVVALDPTATVEARATRQPLLDVGRSAELFVHTANERDVQLGYLGELSASGLKAFDLRGAATVAEVKLSTLSQIANLVPQCSEIPSYPAVERDLNLVVDERVLWADVERTARQAGGPLTEAITLTAEPYRDEARLGAGKKSLLFKLTLRSREGTLTGETADEVTARVVAACQQAHGAQLRA